ncbi:MAG: hypothetical protein WBA22_09210 [Candidatus Methanofastidiosia archaeon]
MGFLKLLEFSLIGGLLGLAFFQVSCQEENSVGDFEIAWLQLEMDFDEEGTVNVIHTAEVTIEPEIETIEYELWSEYDPYIKSITFNGSPKEWGNIEQRECDRMMLPIVMGVDSKERSGKLRIEYEIDSYHLSPSDEKITYFVLMTKIFLGNFERFSTELQEGFVNIIISAPESFPDIKTGLQCNFRYWDAESGSMKRIAHTLSLRRRQGDGKDEYVTKLSPSDKDKIVSDDLNFLDLEIIPVFSSDPPQSYIISQYDVYIDATDPNNIEGTLEMYGIGLSRWPNVIVYFPRYETVELDEFSRYFYNIEKDEGNQGIITIGFLDNQRNFAGTHFNFKLEFKMEYDDFIKYENAFYDEFSWNELFYYRNPDSFRFRIRVPDDCIILDVRPEKYALEYDNGRIIVWYDTALPEEKLESEEFLVKFVPNKKYRDVLLHLLVPIGLLAVIYLFNGKRYHCNNRFLTFLLGWSMWNCLMWFSAKAIPDCSDVLFFSQILIILLYAKSYGHKSPIMLRMFLASLIIILWYLLYISRAVPVINGYMENLFDIGDLGSKILLGILIYLAGKYGRKKIGQLVEASRRNAIHLGTLSFLVFLAMIIHGWAGVRNDIFFGGKIVFTWALGLFLFCLSISRSFSFRDDRNTLKGVLKVTNTIVTNDKICYCGGRVSQIFWASNNRGLEHPSEGESVWMKFSNSNGFPACGLEYDMILINSEISFMGDWLTEDEISRDDEIRIASLKGLIDATYVYKTHDQSPWDDLILQGRGLYELSRKTAERIKAKLSLLSKRV